MDTLEDHLAPLRESISRLEAARGADEALVRRTLAHAEGQTAALRARLESMEARVQALRIEMEQAFDLVTRQLNDVGQLVTLAERQEGMISRLQEGHAQATSSLRRLNQDHILAFNQAIARISGVQGEQATQRKLIGALRVALGATALAVVAVIAFLLGLYLMPPS